MHELDRDLRLSGRVSDDRLPTAVRVPEPEVSIIPHPRLRGRNLPLDLLILLRPHHLPKSLLVIPLPLLDSSVWGLSTIARLGWAVVTFVVASGLIYLGNDIVDRHRDSDHPTKRLRPIAAGRVRISEAAGFAVLLTVLLLALLAVGPQGLVCPVTSYMILNVTYSLWLKHVPLIEMFIVALGFQLRLVAGYVVTGASPSGWLLACVLALCLMMVLGKRRSELDQDSLSHRPALRAYSPALLEHLLVLSAGVGVVAFLLAVNGATLLPLSDDVVVLVSAPVALLCLFRYLQVVFIFHNGDDPVRVLIRDRLIQLVLLLWLLVLAVTWITLR